MSNRFLSISSIAAIALATLGAAPAVAAESGIVHGTKTVGAMTFESRGRATDDVLVHRQGGFALPGAVRWTTTPVQEAHAVASGS